MIISPIIPIWIMGIICIILLILFGSKNKFTLLRQIIILSLIFIINLRIMYLSDNVKTENLELNIDVLFVIDNTVSMKAEDYDGNSPRMKGVKEKCMTIMDKLKGARFSIITFGNKSQILTPMTNDQEALATTLDLLEVEQVTYAQGTTVDESLEDMERVLERLYNNDKKRSRVVFYISDGEDNGGGTRNSFESCQKYITNGAVIGFGTKEGGKMKAERYDGDYEYVKVYNKNNYGMDVALSKIDEDMLKKIAKEMGVDYIHETKKKDLKKKLETIKEQSNEISKDDEQSLHQDLYYIFTIPLLIMLGYEYINYRRKL